MREKAGQRARALAPVDVAAARALVAAERESYHASETEAGAESGQTVRRSRE